MKSSIITLSLVFAAFLSFGQGALFNWAQNYSTPIDKIKLDALSNIYSMGGGSITKRTSSGNLLWSRAITNIKAMDVTPDGDIYIAGGFTGTVNFNSWGAGYPMTSAGNTDIYVSKLNTNGDFVWAQRIGDVGEDSATQISLDTLGHIYLTGKFTGSVDFDPGPSTDILSNGTDFMLKLDTAGNYVWAKELSIITIVVPNGIQLSAVSKNGYLYCVGQALQSADLDPGAGVFNPPHPENNFILQLDPNGSFINSASTDISGWYPPVNIGIAVDNQNNLVYSQSDGSGNGNIHWTGFVKLNSSLSLLGSVGFSTWGTQGANCSIKDIDVDYQNNIYVTGYFRKNITIGSQYYESGFNLYNDVFYASFLTRLNPALQLEWTRIYSKFNILNLSEDGGCYGKSLAVGNNGCVYSTGTFFGNVNFNTYNTPYTMSSNNQATYIASVCNTICNASPTTSVNDTALCLTSINGQVIYTSGLYTANYVNVGGCDSIVTINLTVKQGPDTLYANACSSYTYNNQVYTQSGIYTFPNPVYPMGCDSSTVLNLTINQPSTPSTINVNACWNYTFGGTIYNTSGTYIKHFTNAVGCDSTVTLNLTINYPSNSSLVQTACGLYTLNGITYTTSGLKTQTYTGSNGCDSIVYLYLTIKQPSTPSTINVNACWSYIFGGTTYNTSGTYIKHFTNAVGCDSTVTLNLTINYPSSSSLVQTACGSYTLNGITYTTSGLKTQTYTGSNGCDSIVYLYLTIKQPSTPTSINASACWNYTLNGVTYNSSGSYTQQYTNSVGCDSTVTLNLTINYPTNSSLVQTACGSYTLNGITYTTSGLKTQTYTGSNGCDSIVYLYLTIKQPSTPSTINVNACWNYTLNGITYNWPGTYVQNLTNSQGCDSIVTLNLTVNYPTSSTIVQTSVGQYTLNGITYTSSGLYTQTYIGVNGCDSVVYLYLTISPLNKMMNTGENINTSMDIVLYPNPTSNMITLQSSINMQDATLRIYDMTGALLQEQMNLNGSKFQLNLLQYANGLYQIEIINQGVQYRSRVRKE